jgi:hypothetical protein
MKFDLSTQDHARIQEWLKTKVYPEVIANQRASAQAKGASPNPIREAQWDAGLPYAGAIGGGLTYSFTPTTLGLVTKVRYGDDYELDITDYSD